MQLVEGQRALVTGASRGLGVEIARRLAERGLDLVLAARSEGALDAVASDLRRTSGRQMTTCVADLAEPAAVERLTGLVNQLGGVDVLVNNAGVESTLRFSERPPAEIEHMVAINLTSPMLLTRALLPGMIERGRGHIVNIASMGGVMAMPFNEPYSATKFGLVGFTRSLRLTARACGWPVSASVVCPGFIDGAGLFETLKVDYGISTDGLHASPLEAVGPAVIEAIEGDLLDVFISQADPRQAIAMGITNPAAIEAGFLNSPATAMFRSVADARQSATRGQTVEGPTP
jgi:short-subunit dehydrogenase